jgi:hypothetical protein
MFSIDLLILVVAVSVVTVAYSLLFERDEDEQGDAGRTGREPVRIHVKRG